MHTHKQISGMNHLLSNSIIALCVQKRHYTFTYYRSDSNIVLRSVCML